VTTEPAQPDPATDLDQSQDEEEDSQLAATGPDQDTATGAFQPADTVTTSQPGAGHPEAEALMAVPALLLLVANAATMTGATAWHAGGTAGLAGTAAAAGSTAIATALTRHAHQTQTRRLLAEAAGGTARKSTRSTPGPETRAARRLAARQARRTSRRRAGSGGNSARRSPAASSAGRRSTGGGRLSGLLSGAAPRGKGSAGGGAFLPSSRPGPARGGRPGHGGKTGSGTTGGARPGRSGRAPAAGRRAGGGGPVKAGAAALRSARRAAAAGNARLGRGTHALTDSRAAQKARAARTAGTGGLGRALSTARNLGAATKTAGGPRAAARAARTAAAAAQAERERRSGRARTRTSRVRARIAAAALGATAGSLWMLRGSGRWGLHQVRTWWTRQRLLPGLDPDDPQHAPNDTFPDPGDHTQPGQEAGKPTSTRRDTMGQHIFQGAAETAFSRAVTYDPEGMLDFIAQMDGLSEPLTRFAAAVTLLASKASNDFPLDKAVGEMLAQVGEGMAVAARAAEEIGPLIYRLHPIEIERLRNPRPGEGKWDEQANRR